MVGKNSIKMIDIAKKNIVERIAVAEGQIILKKETIEKIKKGEIKKGDVLTVAQISGINAVKNTSNIIPLCHPLLLTHIKINFDLNNDKIKCTCKVKADYKTGVEMEALAGTTTALLTIWDMVKYLEKDEKGQYPITSIQNIKVIEKYKGV